MTMPVTLILLALFSAMLGFSLWAERRPRDPADLNPPLIPRPFVQFVAFLGIILMLAHLITLLTGKPFSGGRPWLHGQ